MRLITHTATLGAVALTSVFWSTPAHAQVDRPWSVSFNVGGDTAIGGDIHGGATGRVLTLPTAVAAGSHETIFGRGVGWTVGAGYLASPQDEIRVSGTYTPNPSQNRAVGTVAGLPLFAKFDNHTALGMDVGYRRYMGSRMVQPFLGGSVGFTRVEAINSTLTVPAANVTLSDVGFYEPSTVPSFSLSGGTQVAVTARVGFQAGVDFRWHGDLKQREGLAGTGLESINDESRRWAFPITAGMTVRF
jgi:hypothetical protein